MNYKVLGVMIIILFLGFNYLQHKDVQEQEIQIDISEPTSNSYQQDEFIFDIVYPGFHDVHLQKIRELNINHLTVFLCWSQSEPEDDLFNFDITDQRVYKYSELGMPPAAIVIDWWNCRPNWLYEYEETDDIFISELEEFAEKAASRYGDNINYWMIGNEMNGFNWVNPNISKGHIYLYKQVSKAVKRGSPNVRVGTRLAFDSWDADESNWAKFLSEIKDDSDWVGIQAYPVGAGYEVYDNKIAEAVKLVENKSGGLPVWVTETGASTCQCKDAGAPTNNWEECMDNKDSCEIWVDENLQAEFIKANVRDAFEAGAIGVSVYAYADEYGYGLIDEEQYYKNDWKFDAKQAYYAYKDIIINLTVDGTSLR